MQVGALLSDVWRELLSKSWDASSDYGLVVSVGQRLTPIDKLVEQGSSLDLLIKPFVGFFHRQGNDMITTILPEVSHS